MTERMTAERRAELLWEYLFRSDGEARDVIACLNEIDALAAENAELREQRYALVHTLSMLTEETPE